MSNQFTVTIPALAGSTSSPSIRTTGTLYSVTVQGDFDGGIGKLRKRASAALGDNTTPGDFLVVGNDTLTEAGVLNIQVTSGAEIDFILTTHGATGSSLSVHFEKIA